MRLSSAESMEAKAVISLSYGVSHFGGRRAAVFAVIQLWLTENHPEA